MDLSNLGFFYFSRTAKGLQSYLILTQQTDFKKSEGVIGFVDLEKQTIIVSTYLNNQSVSFFNVPDSKSFFNDVLIGGNIPDQNKNIGLTSPVSHAIQSTKNPSLAMGTNREDSGPNTGCWSEKGETLWQKFIGFLSRLFSGNGSSTDTDLTGPHPFEGWSLSWFLSYESSGSGNQSGYDGQNSSGGGGPSTGDPLWEAYDTFSKENIFNYAESLNFYWVDPSYDVNSNSFPPYNPNVDGSYNIQGFRKMGGVYVYSEGTVQNYADDNGHYNSIFSSNNGSVLQFPGATITNIAVLNGYGWTSASGGIHASLGFSLADLQHEYGHFLHAQAVGVSYYNNFVIPSSLYSAAIDITNHKHFWTEIIANALAVAFFGPNSDIANKPLLFPTSK